MIDGRVRKCCDSCETEEQETAPKIFNLCLWEAAEGGVGAHRGGVRGVGWGDDLMVVGKIIPTEKCLKLGGEENNAKFHIEQSLGGMKICTKLRKKNHQVA